MTNEQDPADTAPTESEGTQTQPTQPMSLRTRHDAWNIHVLQGPNMKHLGQRDPRLFGAIESNDELHTQLQQLAGSLGVSVSIFASDYEGDLLERTHTTAADADGYLIDPGGLTTVSEGWRHALSETQKPVLEVHFYNLIAENEISVFTRTAIGRIMGLRQYSYLAGLLGLVLALDDDTFLCPQAPQGPTVRRGGAPYSYENSGASA